MQRRQLIAVALFYGLVVSLDAQAPKPRPQPKEAPAKSAAPSRRATLVVEADLTCLLTIDGEDKGRVAAGGTTKVTIDEGEHIVRCASADHLELIWRKTIEIKGTQTRAAAVELKPLLEAKRRNDEATRAGDSKGAGASILISVDTASRISVDGKEVGQWRANELRSVSVGLGEHLVSAVSLEQNLSTQQLVKVTGGQSLVNLQLAREVATANLTVGMTVGERLAKVFKEGVAAHYAGNFDAAIAKFNEALKTIPQCADCYYNIGVANAGKKDYAKAEEAFKKAIEQKPSAEAYNGLASVYNAQRKPEDAAEAGRQAAELSAAVPRGAASPDVTYNQGVVLWNTGKVAEAKVLFEQVIAGHPNHAEAHYQLGMALVNEGNLKRAGAEFETYLKLAPNGPNAAQAKTLAAQLPK